uniref:Uncharacterized protein n=1 Tax=Rhizophora mucronata TaxID=61149 RepID=A0A2P2MLQ6_RHIMU
MHQLSALSQRPSNSKPLRTNSGHCSSKQVVQYW